LRKQPKRIGLAIVGAGRVGLFRGEVAARHGRGNRSVWDELAAKFSQLVEVLNEVSERTLATSNAGLLRIYEKWIKTGSPRVATLLSAHGVPAVLARAKGRFVQ